jgi:hypothetical protein
VEVIHSVRVGGVVVMSDKLFWNNLFFNAIFIQVVCLGARATVQASHWLLTAKNRDQSHATVYAIRGE